MNRTARTLAALAVVAGTVAAVVAVTTPDTDGLTVRPANADGSHTGAPEEPNGDDVRILDDYAAELGLVMARSRGPQPQAYARRVDGPGDDVQVLQLAGATGDGGAEVVLRLRRDRTRRDGFGWQEQNYAVTGCYRWVFDDRMDEHEPERLEACPDTAVIELGPAPVEPRLPARLVERLSAHLVAGPGPVRAADVLSDVRRQYDAAVASELQRDEVEPEDVMDTATALSDDSVAVVDDAVGVAVGRGTACVFVRVAPADVTVWVPDRMSLQPGEMGCSPAAAATG